MVELPDLPPKRDGVSTGINIAYDSVTGSIFPTTNIAYDSVTGSIFLTTNIAYDSVTENVFPTTNMAYNSLKCGARTNNNIANTIVETEDEHDIQYDGIMENYPVECKCLRLILS